MYTIYINIYIYTYNTTSSYAPNHQPVMYSYNQRRHPHLSVHFAPATAVNFDSLAPTVALEALEALAWRIHMTLSDNHRKTIGKP